MLSPEPCPGGRRCTCWGEEGQPCTSPSAQGSCAPCNPHLTHSLATAALPITQHSLRGMRSESSRGNTGNRGSSPSPSMVSSAVLPQLPSCSWSTGVGMHLHTQMREGGVSFPLVFCQSSSCLPEELRGCPWCMLLSLGSWQQRGREGGPSVSFKYCSSCVLQSVSHADRTVSMSHTEIMPLAYRNMYSQPCSPPFSAFLSSLPRYVSERVWSSVVWC